MFEEFIGKDVVVTMVQNQVEKGTLKAVQDGWIVVYDAKNQKDVNINTDYILVVKEKWS